MLFSTIFLSAPKPKVFVEIVLKNMRMIYNVLDLVLQELMKSHIELEDWFALVVLPSLI